MNTLNLLLSNFVSYSQHFEDFILFYVFYDIPRGFYIDVGAHDPNFISVTKAFYMRGWIGINIEPIPEKHKLFQRFRSRDINLQIGAGEKEGNSTFLVNGEFSSIFYKKNINNPNIININIKTMANICKTYVPKNVQIQFCKIDVENAEKLVLLGYDFINYRPKVFCIETLYNKKEMMSQYKDWENILYENDYGFAYHYGVNRFYYDKRIKGLKEKFNNLNYYIMLYHK